MFPTLLACNMGDLGGLFLMLADVAVMTLTGIVASVVFMTQFSMGRAFSNSGLVARVLTCLFLFAPARGMGITAIG